MFMGLCINDIMGIMGSSLPLTHDDEIGIGFTWQDHYA
jgi:hypothetical protein